jgi:hyperosmotically inducible periplasmic protein
MEIITNNNNRWHAIRYGNDMKKKNNINLIMPLAISSFFLCNGVIPSAMAEDYNMPGARTATASADNSAVNVRDRDSNAVTADKASQDRSDRLLMQKIRKAVVQDKSLSIYAHNVKIVAQNGQVTLIGPVKSSAEVLSIVSKATEIAGAEKVRNELSVKTQ